LQNGRRTHKGSSFKVDERKRRPNTQRTSLDYKDLGAVRLGGGDTVANTEPNQREGFYSAIGGKGIGGKWVKERGGEFFREDTKRNDRATLYVNRTSTVN